MEQSYYNRDDLKKFGDITEWQKELGDKFFDYYGSVFKEGALTAREKSLIALAVSHAIQCPYCIDAYTSTNLKKGVEEEEMMEAIHVAAAIKSGAALVHGVQMMNQVKEKTM
ncbi:MAG: carboxymuconolactone decarboxylase family protein [Cyclobacteriaceae bacterium]